MKIDYQMMEFRKVSVGAAFQAYGKWWIKGKNGTAILESNMRQRIRRWVMFDSHEMVESAVYLV